jgi:hypothetical protein
MGDDLALNTAHSFYPFVVHLQFKNEEYCNQPVFHLPFHHSTTQPHNKLDSRPAKPLPTMHFSTTAIAVLAAASSAAALPTTNNNQSANPSSLARRAVAGKSTFYGGNVQGGTCSFSTYKLPAGLYGTAFSGQVWNSAANCGGCVKVSHGGKSITAMVRKKKEEKEPPRTKEKNEKKASKN